MNYIPKPDGTITSPAGFTAAGIACGIKPSGNPDLAVIQSDVPALVAGAFTCNSFQAAPVLYCKQKLARSKTARAIVVNSGNANSCTGPDGLQDAVAMAAKTAECLGIQADDVLVSSTGVIGLALPMNNVLDGIESAVRELSRDGGAAAARAIMTTDTATKSIGATVEIAGTVVTIGGIAKGAGMLAPSMVPHATMLAYVTTDAAVECAVLEQAVSNTLDQSFNRITVDGDSSTNDSFIALANGRAGNAPIQPGSDEAASFSEAFDYVTAELARMMIMDGEGATKFVEVTVSGAKSKEDARIGARTVANSTLCKTAWFGADPNWGRILDAVGYADISVTPDRVSLRYNGLPIVLNGQNAGTPVQDQVDILKKRQFKLDINLGVGDESFTYWTTDLSYEYVRINAEYHT